MKKQFFALAVLTTLSTNSFSQVKMVTVTQSEKDVIAQELEKEANSPSHDKKTKQQLKKFAEAFKKTTKEIEVEVKALDDCANCTDKSKSQIVMTNIGRKLGKGSSWLTTKTAKPFMNASAFLTGLFENKEKNKDTVALYEFFLNHQKEFDSLYLEAGTPEELVELMIAKMDEIMEAKARIIIQDALLAVGVKKEVPADLFALELTPQEMASIDKSKLNADLINKHPAYQEVRPLIGDFSLSDVTDLITTGYHNKAITFENYKEALPKIHELAATTISHIYAPKIALGVISKTLGGLYAMPVTAAALGTGVSSAVCLQDKTQSKFEADQDLRSFCSYVVNRSGYELVKSRAKGFVAGKKTKAKIQKKIQDRKDRRNKVDDGFDPMDFEGGITPEDQG